MKKKGNRKGATPNGQRPINKAKGFKEIQIKAIRRGESSPSFEIKKERRPKTSEFKVHPNVKTIKKGENSQVWKVRQEEMRSEDRQKDYTV